MPLKCFFIIISLSSFFPIACLSLEKDGPIGTYGGKLEIKVDGGYVVQIERTTNIEEGIALGLIHTIKLKRNGILIWPLNDIKKVDLPLWYRKYTEDTTSWFTLDMVPIRKNKYAVDLNNDKMPEIAMVFWYPGSNPYRDAQILTITGRSLIPYGIGRFNVEFGPNVFFNCPDCGQFFPEECKKCR